MTGVLSLTNIPDGAPEIAAPLRNNFAAIQTAVNDLINTPVGTTTSLFSAGPPVSPSDGDLWIATAVDTGNLATTTGLRWQFQFNATSGSTYKWELVGGSAWLKKVATAESTTSGSYTDLATVGPSIVLARGGDYIFEHGFVGTAGTGNLQAILNVGGSTTGDTAFLGGPGALDGVAWQKNLVTGIAAATTVKVQYLSANGSSATFQNRTLTAIPVRVI